MHVEIGNSLEQEVLDMFDEFQTYMRINRDKSNFLNTQYEYNGGFCE